MMTIFIGSTIRNLVLAYLFQFAGLPYIWGGNDPIRGFDCSGFVMEGLQAGGIFPRNVDYTASQIYWKLSDYEVSKPRKGALVFYKNGAGNINHVEVCINKFQSIGASSGNSTTTTTQQAIDQNAFIKVRPIRKKDVYAYVYPWKKEAFKCDITRNGVYCVK